MDNDQRLDYMMYVAERAGKIIIGCLNRGLRVDHKFDGSIVTNADLFVRDYVRESFTREFPDCGLLTEENEDNLDRLTKKQVIIVDEIDGSNDLRKGGKDFSFLCAFAEKGVPTIGVMYELQNERMFFALKGGDVYVTDKGDTTKLPPLNHVSLDEAVAGHHRNNNFYHYRELYGKLGISDDRIKTSGSMGTRMIQVALQQTHLIVGDTTRLKEWDIAAGHVILEAMGVSVTDMNLSYLRYNKRNPVTEKGILVVHPGIKEEVFARIEDGDFRTNRY